jgi:hypothetical protein
MYETLLHFVHQAPKTFLYFGVGSCPHVSAVENLEPKYDQLLPCFVKDIYQTKPSSRLQVIHIDPAFADTKAHDFLTAYFKKYLPESFYYEQDGLMIWEAPRMQVLVAPMKFSHPNPNDQENSLWFLEAISDEAIANSFQMVYQEFTGESMNPLFQTLYERYDSNLKKQFRKKVLFDISYGTDTGCSTNMVKYKPLYEADGSFLNLQLYSEEELLERIHTHPAVTEILFKTLLGKYRRILNEIHVDYRRKMNGDSLFHPSVYGYSESSTSAEIMDTLKRELFKLVPLLQKVGLLSLEGSQKLSELFQNYQAIDRYKWYDTAIKLVKFEQTINPIQ